MLDLLEPMPNSMEMQVPKKIEVSGMSRLDILEEVIREGYMLTLKEICMQLKVSRSWASKYIRPHLHYIRVANGRGKANKTDNDYISFGMTDWAAILSAQLKYKQEQSLFLNVSDYKKLLHDSIISCQKRSKGIPKTLFLTLEALEKIQEKAYDSYDAKEFYTFMCDEIFGKSENFKNTACYKMYHAQVAVTDRTKAAWVDVEMPENAFNSIEKSWRSVADEKEYGDTDEQIYRKLFAEGCIRIILGVTDESGKESKKVYYLNDPNPLPLQKKNRIDFRRFLSRTGSRGKNLVTWFLKPACIPESVWLQYKDAANLQE